MYPYTNPSVLGKGIELIKGIKWGTLLDSTQKTLGVINQAIPIFYQVKPIFTNAKTLLKIANNLNSTSDNNTSLDEKKEDSKVVESSCDNKPIFYI